MRKLAIAAAAIAVSLPVAIAVSPVTVEAATGCSVGYIGNPPHPTGGYAYCNDLAQGGITGPGEWVRSKASCTNAPTVYYYGPKVYNDGQHSDVYPTCGISGRITNLGLVTGTG